MVSSGSSSAKAVHLTTAIICAGGALAGIACGFAVKALAKAFLASHSGRAVAAKEQPMAAVCVECGAVVPPCETDTKQRSEATKSKKGHKHTKDGRHGHRRGKGKGHGHWHKANKHHARH